MAATREVTVEVALAALKRAGTAKHRDGLRGSGIGVRDQTLHDATIALATRLAASTESRWVGKDVLRDLQRPLVAKKLAKITARQRSSRPARRTAAAPRPRSSAR